MIDAALCLFRSGHPAGPLIAASDTEEVVMKAQSDTGEVRPFALLLTAGLMLASSTLAHGQFRDGWQPLSRIEAGTVVGVRTTEPINTFNADGRVFSGVVDNDVYDSSGRLAIPEG